MLRHSGKPGGGTTDRVDVWLIGFTALREQRFDVSSLGTPVSTGYRNEIEMNVGRSRNNESSGILVGMIPRVGVDDELAKQVRRVGKSYWRLCRPATMSLRLKDRGKSGGGLEPVERLLKHVWRWKRSIAARAQLGLPPKMIENGGPWKVGMQYAAINMIALTKCRCSRHAYAEQTELEET